MPIGWRKNDTSESTSHSLGSLKFLHSEFANVFEIAPGTWAFAEGKRGQSSKKVFGFGSRI